MKVLIVDDDPVLNEINQQIFLTIGVESDLASSGNEAFKLFSSNSYDLVLSDIRMPDGDGIDLLKRIRAISDIPVILLTGMSDLEESELKALGANAVLNKPVQIDTLIDLAESVSQKS